MFALSLSLCVLCTRRPLTCGRFHETEPFEKVPFFVHLICFFCWRIGLEFFYHEAPESMKSIVFSIFMLSIGLGAWLGSLSIVIVNTFPNPWIPNDLDDGYLEYYFFLLAAIMFLSFFIFLKMAKGYTYKDDIEHPYYEIVNGDDDGEGHIHDDDDDNLGTLL